MKNKITFSFLAGIGLAVLTGMVVVQSTGIFILNPATDEIPIKLRVLPSQTTPLEEFVNGNTTVWTIPTNGVISLVNGGTGVSTLADLQALMGVTPTNGIVSVINGGTGNTNDEAASVANYSAKTNTIIYISGVSGITNGSGVVTNLTIVFTTNTTISLGQ